MKEFLSKVNSSKTTKIIFCLVVAIPVWLIISFVNKDPGEIVEATIVEETTIETTTEMVTAEGFGSDIIENPDVPASTPAATVETSETVETDVSNFSDETDATTTIEKETSVSETDAENVTENKQD